mmetsp:Transcript_5749/g.11467  ORF Transcript_5749/g.11467 Transcript_5749/m.11467 type:complete len:209 (+) Transcript_5749:92-718(+)
MVRRYNSDPQFTHLSIDMNHCWQQESQSLSGTCSRYTNQITSQESHGPSLTLDRSRLVKTTFEDFCQDVFGHGRLFKRHGRLGNSRSTDHNSLARTPSLRFLLRTLGNIRMFNVKVLFKRNQFLLRKINLLQVVAEIRASSSSSVTVTAVSSAANVMPSTISASSIGRRYCRLGSTIVSTAAAAAVVSTTAARGAVITATVTVVRHVI